MISDLIGEWIKGILIDGIMGNLSGLFNTVNTKVGEIASDVGTTPQEWNGGIFSMLQSLSEDAAARPADVQEAQDLLQRLLRADDLQEVLR